MAGQFFSSQPSADLPPTSFLTPDVTPGAQEMSRQAFLQNNPAIAAQIAAQRSAQDSQTNDAVDNRAIRLQNQQMFPNLASSYKPVGNEQVSDPIIARKIALSDRDIAANSQMNPINQAVQAVQASRAQANYPTMTTSKPQDRLNSALAQYGQGSVGGPNVDNPLAAFAKLSKGSSAVGKPVDYSALLPHIQEEMGADVNAALPRVNTIAYTPAFHQMQAQDAALGTHNAAQLYAHITGGRSVDMIRKASQLILS